MATSRKRRRLKPAVLLGSALILYILSIQFAYQYFMLLKWGEDYLETNWGHGQITPSTGFFVSVLLAYGVFLVSRMGNRPSDFMHLLFFLTPIIPMCIISGNRGVGLSFILYVMVAFTMSYFVSCISFKRLFGRMRVGLIGEKQYLRLSVLMGVGILLWAIAKGGLDHLNFSFSDSYEFRRGASESRGSLLNYVLLNYVGILISLGFAIAFSRRKIIYIVSLFAINVAIFALTSNKAYLFIGVFALAMHIILSTRSPKFYLTLGLGSVAVGLTVLYLFFPERWLVPTLFVRRYLFVPAYINFFFWDFFSNHSYAYWSDSKFGLGIVESVYGRPTPQVIGDYFSGIDFSNTAQKFNNANTGWLGSGYGNAGVVGMFIYAIMSGVVTKFANILGKLVGNKVAIVGLAFYFFAIFFTSTDLPAALLTYGFFSLCIILFLWKQTNQRSKNPSA
ncbi:MAG: hypothetical protein JKY82_11640 [Rhizobiaceae bacterium]|nr:hypothetical protein [Rhizobiaceae bacterium]MBL4733225.1 hypothetical protein [Rhizobiaceae bacterium]